ncbi:Diphthamide biosynthesis protein 3 [Coemansia asiatica]|uniref:Diphthamide biosynthesis protein 3 n=1 Tax=Coemansia asiatica TaxID=1052880 RepID=A0A9W8CKW3_9FUNG|nr:Diphthamide biosynthesis protein 3 [Coemansia asiatica]KAJ2878485.1 Diphthamide biosynthesis protein 3 [Coemansia asiatica]
MNFYDEIEIEDMVFDENINEYTYPCPCGDQFKITLKQIKDGEDVATCPSCSLIIRVIYDPEDFFDDDDGDENGEGVILIGVQNDGSNDNVEETSAVSSINGSSNGSINGISTDGIVVA